MTRLLDFALIVSGYVVTILAFVVGAPGWVVLLGAVTTTLLLIHRAAIEVDR